MFSAGDKLCARLNTQNKSEEQHLPVYDEINVTAVACHTPYLDSTYQNFFYNEVYGEFKLENKNGLFLIL